VLGIYGFFAQEKCNPSKTAILRSDVDRVTLSRTTAGAAYASDKWQMFSELLFYLKHTLQIPQRAINIDTLSLIFTSAAPQTGG